MNIDSLKALALSLTDFDINPIDTMNQDALQTFVYFGAYELMQALDNQSNVINELKDDIIKLEGKLDRQIQRESELQGLLTDRDLQIERQADKLYEVSYSMDDFVSLLPIDMTEFEKCLPGRKIDAIKMIRVATRWGLKKSKEFVDKYYETILKEPDGDE